MSEHTPGPWPSPELPPECGYVIPHPSQPGEFVAIDIRSLADARLIAAAPELMAALRRAANASANLCDCEHEPSCNCVGLAVNAAISKAVESQ